MSFSLAVQEEELATRDRYQRYPQNRLSALMRQSLWFLQCQRTGVIVISKKIYRLREYNLAEFIHLLPNFSAFHASLSLALCGKVHFSPLHRFPLSHNTRGIGRMGGVADERSRRFLAHTAFTFGSLACRLSWKHLCVIKSIREGSTSRHFSQTKNPAIMAC